MLGPVLKENADAVRKRKAYFYVTLWFIFVVSNGIRPALAQNLKACLPKDMKIVL